MFNNDHSSQNIKSMRFLLALFNFDCDVISFVNEVIFVANKTYIYCGSNDMLIINLCL